MKSTAPLLLLAFGALCSAQPSVSFTEYPIAYGSQPGAIAAGPDGALWFAEGGTSKIGRMTTAGAVTEYPTPTSNSFPYGITAGPDGALWFTEVDGNNIGRITTAGVITEFPIPTSGSEPIYITTGPDGALWFAESTGNKIGRVTTSGTFNEYTVPTANASPWAITSGPDGALWFTEFAGHPTSNIGRITITGTINEYSVPAVISGGIAAGADGALWFTDQGAHKVGRITTDGATVNEYLMPSGGGPYNIIAGPDGALWFTEPNPTAPTIGRITTAAAITEYPDPTAVAFPWVITTGPDGALWFSESTGAQPAGVAFAIGRAAIGLGQTITFGPLSNLNLGSTPPPLSANASSGQPVTFTSDSTSVCQVSEVTITLVNTGFCSITASQLGDATYVAAPSVTQTFEVLPPPSNRTFISTTGSDSNNCSASADCRSFARALAVTNPGGEIVLVNSGGYGPITITQPVIITADDIDSAITATTGNAITINTTGNVTINGLNLNGGGTGNDGILVEAVGFLRLYNVQIQNFANDGIEFRADGNLAVYDSKINDSGEVGLLLDSGTAQAFVSTTEFDHNTYGADSIGGKMTIADSSAHYNQVGFIANIGTMALDNDRVIFNSVGLEATNFGSSLYFANCLISDNTTAWSVAAGGTMTDTNPGTSLITPGQGTVGTLSAATVLQ